MISGDPRTAAAPIVLSEKLRRPAATGLARARLEAPLLDLASPNLALIVAPPGSGKTTLLARVAAGAAVPTAWYRVAAEDATEAALVSHLAKALADAIGIEPVPRADMDELLAAVDRWPGSRAILVIDDLHEIKDTAAELALERFVDLRPGRLRLLLGSRRPPSFNIPRFRVSGSLREITSEDLRFRSWEVEELFATVYREPLAPEAAAALTRRTGGWAAGLQLFHLATATKSAAERNHAVAELCARSRLVRSYLARNVLAGMGEGRRQFLLRTCTLGVLTGPLCDTLLATTGSGKVLEELEQQQLFTSSDDHGLTFRYHQVLQTHLELTLVDELGPAGARSWYARSAEILEAAGALRDALRAYARAEDWASVARLIRRDESDLTTGIAPAAEDLLPAHLRERDPWLALAAARWRFRHGAVQAAANGFRNAETMLDEPEFRRRCRDERALVMVWQAPPPDSLRSWERVAGQAHWSHRLRTATRHAPGRLATPPPDPTPGDRLAAGLAALLAGQFVDAATLLESVTADATAAAAERFAAQLGVTVSELVTDRCADPVGQLEEIALSAEVDGQPWLARLAHGLLTVVLVASGSPVRRIAACSDLVAQCERDGDPWGAALLQLCVGATGRAAGGMCADAAARFRGLDAPVLAVWADALQVYREAHESRPGVIGEARRVEAAARVLGIRGAQALSYAALARASAAVRSSQYTRLATEIAQGCGIPSSVLFPGLDRNVPTPVSEPVLRRHDVRLSCLGGFHLEVAGEPVDLSSLRPRARALLRLLAVCHDRDVHRERLVDTFWPGASVAVGTRRLQVAVSNVRRALDSSGLPAALMLRRSGDAYRLLLPDGGRLDIREFEDALRRAASAAGRGDLLEGIAARQAALELYRGELLPEDGPADWVVTERERLRLAAAGAAADLARDHRALGELPAALSAAQRSVQLDPFRDLSWRLLTDLYREAGDASAAAHARLEHERVRQELEETRLGVSRLPRPRVGEFTRPRS